MIDECVEMILCDCLEYMAKTPDNFFSLAVVDPPYGIGNFIPQTGKQTGKDAKKLFVQWNDNGPSDLYFSEVRRISKHQIIWGANYFNCFGDKGGALVWYKGKSNPKFSACEIASHSFRKRVDYIHINWQAGFYRKRFGRQIHPCQKPVELYDWIYDRYLNDGGTVFDSHMGSGSSAISARKNNIDFVGTEIDKTFFDDSVSRYKEEVSAIARSFDKVECPDGKARPFNPGVQHKLL